MRKDVFLIATIYLETGSTNPHYNLAFEEYVLLNRREGDYLMLWQNDNAIIIGQNQNTEAEINRAFVDAHGIRVVRRSTGGGAVYHDLGNLNYSFITDAGDIDHMAMTRFTTPVVRALTGLGLRAEASGRNDILVEGKKVSGTAQRLAGGRILYHGTLLFDANAEMIADALQADPEKFKSKSTKSVRSRVGNIRAFLPQDMDMRAFWDYLKSSLAADGVTQSELTAEELAAVTQLQHDKYDTWEWNYGRSPKSSMQAKRRFPGGSVEALLSVRQGCIDEIAFYGDFLSLSPLDSLREALCGCPFRREEVAARLSSLPLSQYFGAITQDEILSLLFE